MTTPANIPPPSPRPGDESIGPAGVVRQQAPCRKCGYALRGLSVEGRCPECGAPVGLSVHGDLLNCSDPLWVHGLARGTRLILYGVAVMILGTIVSIPVVVAHNASGLAMMGLSLIAGYLVLIYGTWLLTQPDPSGIGEDRYGRSRQIIRVSLFVGMGGMMVDLGGEAMTLSPNARLALVIFSLVTGIVAVVGTVAQLDYLRKLSFRIPDYELAQRAHFLLYALGTTYAAFTLMIAAGELVAIRGGALPAPGAAGAGAFIAAACAVALAGLLMLIFTIMFLVLVNKMGKRFTEEAVSAENLWIRETAKSRTFAP